MNEVYNDEWGSSSGTNLIACTSFRRENRSGINVVLYSSRGRYSSMGSRNEMPTAIKNVRVTGRLQWMRFEFFFLVDTGGGVASLRSVRGSELSDF